MISRRHLHILDVVSVLLFSLLANFLLLVPIDFGAPLDWLTVCRLFAILASSVVFYFTVDLLKRTDRYAEREFDSEVDLSRKAAYSAEDRYQDYLKEETARVRFGFIFASVCLVVFFFAGPLAAAL